MACGPTATTEQRRRGRHWPEKGGGGARDLDHPPPPGDAHFLKGAPAAPCCVWVRDTLIHGKGAWGEGGDLADPPCPQGQTTHSSGTKKIFLGGKMKF